MLKKNSWIAALLLALSLTAFLFTGCVNPLKVEEDTETYEEYPLDKGYNAWAGQVYQKGWATGGIKFQGKGDAIVIAKDVGYDIEMFQKATKLKIEMPDASYPRSGVDIIWGGEDAEGDSTKGGGMWNQQPIAGGSGDIDTTFAKKDGNVLIIDLTKALKNYSSYTKAAKLKIVMQVNAPSYGDVEGLVQKAFLMIPNTPPPFVNVGSLQLPVQEMYWTQDFELVPRIRPDNATNQSVTWSLQGWEPDAVAGNTDVSAVKLDLKSKLPAGKTYDEIKGLLVKKINWKQEETVEDNSFFPYQTGTKSIVGTLAVPYEDLGLADGKGSIGTVTVYGVIKNATQDKDGKFADKTATFTVRILNPLPFTYKVGGTPYTTVVYGAVDNGGVSGGKMDIDTKDENGALLSPPYTSYTAIYSPTGGQYGNSAHYVEITLPAGKKLDNYKQLTCHYVSENCDLTGKSVRMKAMTTKPGRTYNPGPYVATISFSSGSFAPNSNGKDTDLTFDFYEDKASNADGTSNQGIYNKGVGADLSAAGTDAENASRYVTKDKDDNDVELKNANKIYIWFLPWGGVGTKFTISDINFVPK